MRPPSSSQLKRAETRVTAVIAIPAHNEAAHIERCLAALAMQRDEAGAPVRKGAFQILVFANSCADATADIARRFGALVPHPISVIEEKLPRDQQSAGWARKRAMDLAATGLIEQGAARGVIFTTDADSCVAPTWFAASLREFENGVDCVAGYIDAQPLELTSLGSAFLERGRLEDTYLRLVAEIYARCDPIAHDPWPNHRVSSGASLAVTLAAYTAIGGLPPRPVGEDSALTEALDRAGFKIRHSMEVSVATSCRFDGRAEGGAADTMRLRHAIPDSPCDDDLEPALKAVRRAIYRGHLRKHWNTWPGESLPRGLHVSEVAFNSLMQREAPFEDIWQLVCRENEVLKRGQPLRPSDLPRQIAMAHIILRQLRLPASSPKTVPAGTHRSEVFPEPAF